MIESVKDKVRKVGITRDQRIENYLEFLEEKIKVTDKNDYNTLKDLKILMEERYKAIDSLHYIVLISYIGIYFSFLSFFMSELLIVSDIAGFFGNIVGFFGTTIFFVMLFFAERLSSLHYQDLNLMAAHCIAIYQRYDSRKPESLFEDLNNYSKYIQYFRNRGL